MSPQLRLPGLNPPHQLQPSAGRKEPEFWVRRLQILRELKPGAEHIIRDVELRRGLNIVWAPSHEPTGENTLFQSGVAGHTAGKTMFCRLIRHVLGEYGFATDSTRRRVREKLPTGWVVAEVVVGDVQWVVGRPFTIGPHSFCIPGGTTSQATDGTRRKEYQVFLDAISDQTIAKLSAARFPASDEPIRWDHVLPWLSRDQECRYADFLEWRHSSSDSETPSLNVDERQFVMRSVLGLISDDERAEQQTNALLVDRKKEAALREPLLAHQARVDHGRVSKSLGMELAPPSTPLFGSQARAELDRRIAELDGLERDITLADRHSELRAILDGAIAFEVNAKRDLQDIENLLALERTTLQELAGNSQAALLINLPPSRDYCSVRMTVAREHGCPLAISRPVALAEHRSERTAEEELRDHRARVQRLEAAVETERHTVAEAVSATSIARQNLLRSSTEFEEARGRVLSDRAQLAQIARLVHQAEEAWAAAAEHAEAVVRIDREIVESYGRQEQLRHEGREAVERFSTTFDYVVRAILGDEVSGRVDTSGRSLSLVVEEHGERDSAAIATVKLLAFDFAALTASAEGRGTFPRFLIHDGPREADMASDIYDRLFILVRELEKCFEGEPSFQYIVTTTTAPPPECANEPWLRLRLSGVPAEERFLRCDL